MVTLPEEDRFMATGNKHRIFGHVVPKTQRLTDMVITVLGSAAEVE